MKSSFRLAMAFACAFLCAPLSLLANETLEKQMLTHVEKIIVVDSLAVPKDEFFRNYKIQPSAGRILPGSEVGRLLQKVSFPSEFIEEPLTGFTNEFNDYLIWAQADTTGYLRLAESVRLNDGSWSSPGFTPPVLNFGSQSDDDQAVEANAAFPFMLDDGQTLYFAADNENSLGGYDIFVASKDPADGEFLIPRNLGMPFNSEFDDYLLVLDNQTGVGWWATDRNQLDDLLTIYIYVLSDDRVNVDVNDPELRNYASLIGWQQRIEEDDENLIASLKKDIEGITFKDFRPYEFSLPMGSNVVYHYLSDFKNSKAASLMQRYLKNLSDFNAASSRLSSLRAEFKKSPSGRLSEDILNMEKSLREDEKNLKDILSQIYKYELDK